MSIIQPGPARFLTSKPVHWLQFFSSFFALLLHPFLVPLVNRCFDLLVVLPGVRHVESGYFIPGQPVKVFVKVEFPPGIVVLFRKGISAVAQMIPGEFIDATDTKGLRWQDLALSELFDRIRTALF